MSNRPNPNKKPPASQRVQQAQASSSARVWWIAGGAVVVVALLLVVAVVASRESGTVGGLTYGTVTVTGADLPELPSGGTDAAIGMTVPEVVGQRFDGSAITIPVSGKPKIVMLVAHWCSHCQKEVPLLADYLNSSGMPTDVDLFTISTSADESGGNWSPAEWLSREQWPVPTLVDNGQGTAGKAYGLNGFPGFVVVDASGKVVDRQSGEKTIDQFTHMLDEARTGQASPS